MRSTGCALLAVVLLSASTVALADNAPAKTSWLAWENVLAAAQGGATTQPAEAAPAGDGPPIPLINIDGTAGGIITPMAYMCNLGPTVGKPAAAVTYVSLGSKNLWTVGITNTFFGFLEVGYGLGVMDLGSLPDDLGKAGLSHGRQHVALHQFNLRAMVLKEDSFDLPLPAVTVGVHFKYNDGISVINNRLGGALRSVGYDKCYGVDWTVTASKMVKDPFFQRPLIGSIGMRISRAAQLGYLGFGDDCNVTLEGNVAYLPTDQLMLAYEFRQKNNPYNKSLASLIGDEDNWHAWSATWLIDSHWSVTGVLGCFGRVINATPDCSFAFSLKYEF